MPYVRPAIEAMTGYVPGEQPDRPEMVKLNANENPYAPSPRAVEAMRAEAAKVGRYPESSSRVVREAAAAIYGVDPDEVLVGNGSDEMLRILLQACAGEGDEVVAFTPSYTYYKTLAAIQGARYREIEFLEDYGLPPKLETADARLVFLPNPNAPSGTLFTEREILRLADATPRGLVVVDEAYADFAGTTAIPLLRQRPNLFVTRTFSKSYALAGLRVGLGFAAPGLIAQLDKVRDFYNVDRIAQAGAAAALRDQPYLRKTLSKTVATRERLRQALEERGVFVWPSAANFVLARFGDPRAADLLLRLKERGILVRHFNAPRLRDCLRISVGTDEEIDALLRALDAVSAS